jgi:hypothetical protein
MPDLKNAPNVNLLLQNETRQIIGCAFDVINEVGHGFHEKIYENPQLQWERVIL